MDIIIKINSFEEVEELVPLLISKSLIYREWGSLKERYLEMNKSAQKFNGECYILVWTKNKEWDIFHSDFNNTDNHSFIKNRKVFTSYEYIIKEAFLKLDKIIKKKEFL